MTATATKTIKTVSAKWASQRNLNRHDPEKVLDALQDLLRKHDGRLTPGIVVKAARSKRSQLHLCFDWDDAVAADKWRLTQARSLLCCLEERCADDEFRPLVVHTADDDGPCYQQRARVASSPILMEATLAEAVQQLRGFQRRYSHLSELGKVLTAINELQEQKP